MERERSSIIDSKAVKNAVWLSRLMGAVMFIYMRVVSANATEEERWRDFIRIFNSDHQADTGISLSDFQHPTDASGNMLIDHPSGDAIFSKHEKLKRLRRKRNTSSG